MKKILQALFIAVLVAGASVAQAQVRYLDEVFSNVQVDSNILYARNYGFFSNFQNFDSLYMDVYRPAGDTATNRPVILLSHNGSFLPEAFTHALIGLCFGGRRDSSLVEMCKRFARRGYVAVSFDYRLGWNATSGVQEVRTQTIIQAVYRAMQDAKSCVRYFKNDFANNSNHWGIDTGKFVIGGTNSGAYVALAASSLNDTSELTNVKFVGSNGPFIKQDTIGSFDGFGGVQNYDNYPGISSRFQCVLSLGGAVGDTSWIQAGETPIIAFHGVNETGTPYNTNIVVTTTNQPVIEVSGSGDFMPYVEAKGNNAAFLPNNFLKGPKNIDANQQQTHVIEGLYPCYGQGFEPWNWYDAACYTGSAVMQGLNPGASYSKANRYIDTIMAYTLPRLYKLFIDHNFTTWTTGVEDLTTQADINLLPNPASSQIRISVNADQQPISSIQFYDISGRLVQELTHINASLQTVDVSQLNSGIYLVAVKLTDGLSATRKVAIGK